MFCQESQDSRTGEIVIAKRRVTNMARQQYFIDGFPFEIVLSVCHASRLQSGVDANVVLLVGQP